MFRALVLCLLTVSTICSATTCPHTATNAHSSESNSDSQASRDCNVASICDCSATTLPPSATNSPAASTVYAGATSFSLYLNGSTGPVDNSTSTFQSALPSSTIASSSVGSSSTNSPPASPPPAEPCPCILMQELNRMKYAYLSYSQQVRFEVCLVQIRIVLLDSTLSVKRKVSKISAIITQCFIDYVDIKLKLKWKKIAGWGRMFEFCNTGVGFSNEIVDSVIAPLDNTGRCAVTDALLNATANDVCGAGTSVQVQLFCKYMRRVFKKQTPGFDKGRKLGWCKKACRKNFFPSISVQLQTCVLNANIPGFGSFGELLALGSMNEKVNSIGSNVLNGTADDCALYKSMNQSINSNTTAQNYNASTIAEANNYCSSVHSFFLGTLDIHLRLQFVSAQFSALSTACHELLYAIIIQGISFDCDFSEVLSASHFCTNNNATFSNSSCSESWPETCQIDQASNSTDFQDCFDQDFYNLLTQTQKISVNSYRNSIINCQYKLYPNDPFSAWVCCQYYVQQFAKNVASLKAALLGVVVCPVLYETTVTVTYGTIGGFCGCS